MLSSAFTFCLHCVSTGYMITLSRNPKSLFPNSIVCLEASSGPSIWVSILCLSLPYNRLSYGGQARRSHLSLSVSNCFTVSSFVITHRVQLSMFDAVVTLHGPHFSQSWAPLLLRSSDALGSWQDTRLIWLQLVALVLTMC